MSETTAGQAAYEAMHASIRSRDPAHLQIGWDDLDEYLGWDGLNRSDMHAAAAAAIGHAADHAEHARADELTRVRRELDQAQAELELLRRNRGIQIGNANTQFNSF